MEATEETSDTMILKKIMNLIIPLFTDLGRLSSLNLIRWPV